jgi:hypothetical protein
MFKGLLVLAVLSVALAAESFQKRVFNAARDGKMSDYQRAMKEWDAQIQKELKALKNKPAPKDKNDLPHIDVNYYDEKVCI